MTTVDTATTQPNSRAPSACIAVLSRAPFRAGLPQLPDGTFDVQACRAWLGERLSATRPRGPRGPGAFDPRASRRRPYC